MSNPQTIFGHPDPQFQRDAWICLNGPWQFALDDDVRWTHPAQAKWDRTIQVPFAVETPLSGVADEGFHKSVWYRRSFEAPRRPASQRLILHFEAVDYLAEVWINGALAVRHEGGYTPFEADITDLLIEGKKQEIVVRAQDDPADLHKPRGKQDWQLTPHVIWYPRTTGIWQTVWLESVSPVHIASVRFTPDVPNWRIRIQTTIGGVGQQPAASPKTLRVRLSINGKTLAEDQYALAGDRIDRHIHLPDDGIARDIQWDPDHPHLIDVELELLDAQGQVVDRVQSYTAMRSVEAREGRFLLNGLPIPLRLVLDQGYWPDGGLTAPDDQALKRDVELIKQMGFNGVRLHQKIECRRFLHWADKLGLMVWGEMPSAYAFAPDTVRRVTHQWTQAIQRDINHPCIVAWVPINESWGVPDLPDRPDQRDFLSALYHLTRALDPTRPVSGNDGWMMDQTDLLGVHDYHHDPEILRRRYHGEPPRERELVDRLQHLHPAGRPLFLDGFHYRAQPLILSEFGGIACGKPGGKKDRSWGYSRADSPRDLADRYGRLMVALRSVSNLAGFCYTQFTDTYQEANGLLNMDRTPKFPLEQMAVATRGPCSEKERRIEAQWHAAAD
jgi:beta-galactosidase/beta-glucuronidase